MIEFVKAKGCFLAPSMNLNELRGEYFIQIKIMNEHRKPSLRLKSEVDKYIVLIKKMALTFKLSLLLCNCKSVVYYK